MLVLALLGALLTPLCAEETPAAKSTTPYPGLLVALPIDSGLSVRWACPPLDKEQVAKTSTYEMRLGVDASGAVWLGRGPLLICPGKELVCETSCPYTGFVFLDNGALLLSTATDWGYLVPAAKPTPPGNRPPVVAYQPVAALPVPGAQILAGAGDTLLFFGSNPATGKYDVYALLTGALGSTAAGPLAYTPVFTSEEPIAAVAAGKDRIFVAIGDVVVQVSTLDGTLVSKQRVDDAIRQLACVGDVLYYATYSRVGALTPHGTMEVLTARDSRLAARDGTLYVALPETLGVLALDHAANLAKYDLNVPAVSAAVTPNVRLTDVRCFEGGAEMPRDEDRVYATTFARVTGRYLWVQAEVENLRPDQKHTENVQIHVSFDNGYWRLNPDLDTHILEFDAGQPKLSGWLRLPLPGPREYTITTSLNGVAADARTITVTGTKSVVEAAGWFDVARLEEALRRGESANARTGDGTPLLVAVADGLTSLGSTPEGRGRITEVVRLLLEHGADPKARDAKGNTALHKAADANFDNAEVITLLLKAGADVNATNEAGDTPLLAAFRPNLASVRALLVNGNNLNARGKDGHTAMDKAVFFSQPAVVEVLAAAGADPLIKDGEGGSALFTAASGGLHAFDPLYAFDPEMLRALLAAGANPSAIATIKGQEHSLLGYLLTFAAYRTGPPSFIPFYTAADERKFPPAVKQAVDLLVARGAGLLREECGLVYRYGLHRLFSQARLERILAGDTRTAEDPQAAFGARPLRILMIDETASIDDPNLQRAAINVLLARSRARVAGATSITDYEEALDLCAGARARMQVFLKPESTWVPQVFYNCALLEAHLGDFASAQDDLHHYLALAPQAKDAPQVQALLKEYARQEVTLRPPIKPASLVGIWRPEGPAPDREKFFRLEFAIHKGKLQARVLALQGWEKSFPASTWVDATIANNRVTIYGAVFYHSSTGDHNPYDCSLSLDRIGENRLKGTITFNWYVIQDGQRTRVGNHKYLEWRRR